MALKQPSGFMTRESSGTVERPTRKTAGDVLEKLDESKVDIAKGAAEFIPGVGEAMAVKRVSDAMDEKDYVGAGIETAAGALGLIPVVGDMAGKGLRVATKKFRKADVEEAEKLIADPKKIDEWRSLNKLPESQRQKNIPEAQQAAEDLFQNKIKSKEARKQIKDAFPEPKLYTSETMPEMPTVTDVVGSMGKKSEKGILGVRGFDLEPGQRVGARLDIPAYNEYDKWVVSIHDGKSRNGSVVGYGQAIRLKNIEFGSDPKVALDIAKGKRVAKTTGEEKPMGKATIARVFGDYVPEDPYELQMFAKKILADKDSSWTQVGMNPYRGSYFYDKATGTPITRADEVIQVGPLVLAKNVTKPKVSELKQMFKPAARTVEGKLRIFSEGGAVPMKEQMSMFEDGGLMDEGNTIDPVSGNDVPPGSTQEEVRDDIPAQLSEGEFVFPADVVRYIGLEKLMQMRQQAKMGLQTMEDMGQMGNSEEAVMPDNLPFELTDLDMDDEEEYNNDTVELQQGGLLGPATGISGYVPSQVPATSFVSQPQAPVTPTVQQPTQAATPIAPTYTPPTQQAVPTFTPEQMQDVSYPGVVQTPESAPQTVEIINPTTGEKRTITYIPGVTQLPEGFVLASEYTAPETPTVTPTVGQAQVRKDDDDGGSPDFSGYENMQARIKEAQRLGFMDVINPFEQLFKSTAIGSMFGGNFKQGQVVNGYIADGMGNLYDPITGRYVQKESIIGQIGEFFNPSELPKKSEEFQNDLVSLIIDKDPTIMSATNASNEIKKVSNSIAKALQSGSNEDREKAQEDSDNFSKTYLSGKTVNEIKLAEELRKEEKESNFEDIIAKAKEAARKQRSIEIQKQLVKDEEKRKQNKKDKEREKKLTSNFSKDKAKSIKEAIKSSTSSGGRLATGGRAKGGLMEKEIKQPKQMRSGGLASKK